MPNIFFSTLRTPSFTAKVFCFRPRSRLCEGLDDACQRGSTGPRCSRAGNGVKVRPGAVDGDLFKCQHAINGESVALKMGLAFRQRPCYRAGSQTECRHPKGVHARAKFSRQCAPRGVSPHRKPIDGVWFE